MTTYMYLELDNRCFTHASEVGRSFAVFGGSCAPDVMQAMVQHLKAFHLLHKVSASALVQKYYMNTAPFQFITGT